ncbi:hypothetical protein ACMU_06195 [Actibacterium mucosum KCTC 23349]|uniref:DUF560 domain-containing protein n=1 Tax=Actibacterium mucosum KCTC 23349 TaxID=1454373 RepID=A0A037ZK99_9RHOB|nr:surface lipoprotein assembly modifier [Actibacterium mucosum]KAJ56528.1 hypothetical protein ACMU_06195 [Actibacterium mucosum KCTC 23349]
MRRALLFAAWLALCPALSFAEATDLSPGQIRDAARTALKTGQPEIARDLAAALLERDASDISAKLLQARAVRDLREFDQSIALAKDAFDLAQTDLQRYAAAMVVAQALSSKGARTRAQLWLRRAVDLAPDERLKANAIRDFQYVRDRNPWSSNLSFGATPNSNVNNGSKSDTVIIDGIEQTLNGDAKALSGMEYQLSADTEYSRQLSERMWVFGGGAVEMRRYTLSSAAKAQAVSLTGSDLRYDEAELTFGTTFFATPSAGPTTAAVSAGRGWYAGAPLVDFVRLSVDQTVPISQTKRLSFALLGDSQTRINDPINSSVSWTAQTALSQKMGNGDRLQYSLSLRDTASDGGATAHEGWSAGITWTRAKPVAGMQLSAGLTFDGRHYDEAFFGTERRADRGVSAEISVVLPKLEKFGFAPEISFSAAQNLSNVGLYETRDYGVTFGFRSAF